MKFILSLLFASQTAFAGLPPTTMKGQAETAKTTTFNVQVPNTQATTVGAGTRLIETGNDNQLVNPGFEASTTMSGWTLGTGVTQPAVQSAGFGFPGGGAKTPVLSLSSVSSGASVLSQTLASQTNQGLLPGNIYMASIWAQVTSSKYSLCGTLDGTETNCVPMPLAVGLADYQKTSILIIPGKTTQTIGIKIKATAAISSDAIAVDNAYLGLAPAGMVGTSTPDTVWQDAGANVVTATTTAPTHGTATIATDRISWKRNGPNLDARIEYSQTAAGTATAGSGDYLWAIPSASGCTIDSSKVTFETTAGNAAVANSVGSGSVAVVGVSAGPAEVTAYDTTHVRILAKSSDTANYLPVGSANFHFANASIKYSATFSVPCSGWTPQTAIQTQNSNQGWTAYTPTITGLGTVTNVNYFYRHNGENIEVTGTHTNGTVAASLVSISLPSGLSIDTSKVGISNTTAAAGRAIGKLVDNGSAASECNMVTATGTSTSVIYMGANTTNASKLTPQNGSGAVNSSAVDTVYFKVPISGWSENQNAPQLVGSVVNGGQGVTTAFTFMYAGASVTTDCANGACTIYNNTGPSGLSVNNSSAVYTVTVPSGTCGSTNLACNINSSGAPAYSAPASAPTLTTFSWATYNSAFAATNGHGVVHCECLK